MSSITNTMPSHTFFCIETTCNRETSLPNSKCPVCACPGCGDVGATIVGSDYCHTCLSVRDHPCNRAFVDYDHDHTGRCGWADDGTRICGDEDATCRGCGILIANGEEVCDGCRIQYSFDEDEYYSASRCTCDGSGRMCQTCDEESSDPCWGCGSHSLWSDSYCLKCYEVRYGPRHSSVSSPSPVRSPDELREIIEEIEVRIRGGLTKEQRDDWIWILQNRRADLAAAEKEMWEGYDQDDLNKLDLQNRRGF
jgi:hypothetical protein